MSSASRLASERCSSGSKLARSPLVGILGERARPGREGLPRIVALALFDLSNLGQDLQARPQRVLALQPQLEQLHQRAPLARVARPTVFGRARQDVAIALHRALSVAQLLLEQPRRPEGETLPLGRAPFGVRPHIQDLQQLGVLRLPREDAIEQLERLGIPRMRVQHGAQLAGRLERFLQLLVV